MGIPKEEEIRRKSLKFSSTEFSVGELMEYLAQFPSHATVMISRSEGLFFCKQAYYLWDLMDEEEYCVLTDIKAEKNNGS